MTPEIEIYLTLLDRRLSLLRLLAQEFVDCRKEFVGLDLDGMYRRISDQEELCRQIHRLHPGIRALEKTCAAQLGLLTPGAVRSPENAEWAARLSGVIRELEKTQAEVGRLNQIHAAYLRRSRKTIDVLMNYVGRYAMMYARPGESAAASPCELQKGQNHG